MSKITPVIVDGVLYVCIAAFTTIQTVFTTDEAYKYVSPYTLFWIKAFVSILGSCAGALKMFRSTTYSDHLKQKAEDEAAQTIPPATDPNTQPKNP